MLNKLYNYIFGYTEIECKKCKKKFIVKNNHIGIKTGITIMCSNNCIFNSQV